MEFIKVQRQANLGRRTARLGEKARVQKNPTAN